MFGKSFELFEIFGFKIRVDVSWFVLALLITWSLAAPPNGWFPSLYKDLAPATYWSMGVAGAVGLFISIVLHELSHALMARRFGLPMRGITLFIFGGVAEMTDEPPSPKAEFFVAIAGPIASIAIAIACWLIAGVGAAGGWPLALTGVLSYLALINAVLVAFNLIPAFPLDGGRVLRSALWQWQGSLSSATRVTSQIGSVFGIVLIALGVLSVVTGNFVSGMWWFLIGLFLRNAAQMSYQQVLVRRVLEGEPVRRFMETDPVTVSRAASVRQLVEDYVYRYHFKMFPVVDNGRLLGCVTTRQIKSLPPSEWDRQSVSALMETCSADNTVGPESDALKALSIMNRTRSSRLMVVEGGRLVGIIALKDMLKFLSLKIELEGAGD